MKDKQEAAAKAAALIDIAAKVIQSAVEVMEYYGLNLENYPEHWQDFSEHPEELKNIFITDFEDVQVQVKEAA